MKPFTTPFNLPREICLIVAAYLGWCPPKDTPQERPGCSRRNRFQNGLTSGILSISISQQRCSYRRCLETATCHPGENKCHSTYLYELLGFITNMCHQRRPITSRAQWWLYAGTLAFNLLLIRLFLFPSYTMRVSPTFGTRHIFSSWIFHMSSVEAAMGECVCNLDVVKMVSRIVVPSRA